MSLRNGHYVFNSILEFELCLEVRYPIQVVSRFQDLRTIYFRTLQVMLRPLTLCIAE